MMHYFKSFLFLALLGCLIAIGCGEDATTDKSEADSLTVNAERGIDNTTDTRNDDERFLSDAVEANTMELKALALGKEKGSKEIKSHADHMMSDHRKLDQEVKKYLADKSITLSDVDTANRDDELREKAAGKDFDKAWVDKMVGDHEKVIRMFEDAQQEVADSTLKTMITGALPKLRSHLEMSKQLQQKIDK